MHTTTLHPTAPTHTHAPLYEPRPDPRSRLGGRWIALGAVALLASACATAPKPAVSPKPATTDAASKAWTTRALARASERVTAAAEPSRVTAAAVALTREPPELPYGELLRPDRVIPGTLSLGNTSHGTLGAAAELPVDGPHHGVFAHCQKRKTNWGTHELVELLQHASQEVATKIDDTPRLMVCNMSYKGGGDISWSKSHNSGRDVDIAFYMLRGGKPAEAPSLMNFGPKLTSSDGYTFDVPRNWALVRALVTHPTIQVQWLFISKPLKRALLEHAESLGEPASVIQRANDVLHQPTDSSPHSDHLHLRIYCPRKDRLEGCHDTGPTWAWAKTHDKAVARRAKALIDGLWDDDATTRAAALDFLIKLQARQAASDVAEIALLDPDPAVRIKALVALRLWRANDPDVLLAIEHLIRRPGDDMLRGDPDFEHRAPAPARLQARTDAPSPIASATAASNDAALPPTSGASPQDPYTDTARTRAVLESAYQTLAQIADDASVDLLVRALHSKRLLPPPPGADNDEPTPEPMLAARAARHIMDLRLVPGLIEALDIPHQATRVEAARTLRRITNHTFDVTWGDSMSNTRRSKRVAKWRAWWAKRKGDSRDALLLRGFKKHKRSLRKLKKLESWTTVDKLVPLTKRDDFIGYNADRTLVRVTGRWSPRSGKDPAWKHKRWRRWWKRNKKRLKKRWR